MGRGKPFLFVSLLGECQAFKQCVETLEPEMPVFNSRKGCARPVALVEYKEYCR